MQLQQQGGFDLSARGGCRTGLPLQNPTMTIPINRNTFPLLLVPPSRPKISAFDSLTHRPVSLQASLSTLEP